MDVNHVLKYRKRARDNGTEMRRAVAAVLHEMIDDNITFSMVHGRPTVHTTQRLRNRLVPGLRPLIRTWIDLPEEMRQRAYPGSSFYQNPPEDNFIGFTLDLEHPSGYACLKVYYTGFVLPLWSHDSDVGTFFRDTVKRKSTLKVFLKALLKTHPYTDFPIH